MSNRLVSFSCLSDIDVMAPLHLQIITCSLFQYCSAHHIHTNFQKELGQYYTSNCTTGVVNQIQETNM